MKIDGHSVPSKALEAAQAGDFKGAQKMQKVWVDEIAASGEDHCPCKVNCIHHGNCFECVQIHRGHRDHLPFCMWDMVNERIDKLAGLTEGSFLQYRQSCAASCACREDDR
ncbi:MAG: LPS biosynthesis protein [Eubacteriales bacterium]|nr:LPS biosynthesis protein [Eubacteriales bacterium]